MQKRKIDFSLQTMGWNKSFDLFAWSQWDLKLIIEYSKWSNF